MAKVAVSIPDDLYERADRIAASDGVSRSELYARALREYLDPRDDAEITRRLNDAYADGGGDAAWLDAAARELARALQDDEW